jgi:membrane protease YdiL (CAAX protease family)
MYGLGFITLFMAPFGWILCGFPPLESFLQLDKLVSLPSAYGLVYGTISGLMMIWFTSNQEATTSFQQQIRMVQSMRLTILDCIFLSICAGFGEEIVFRIALQQWLHPLLTAVIFVAVHGYLRPKNWNTTKYGLLVLLFSIGLGYAVDSEGLWFCIIAHSAYDFVIFIFWSRFATNPTAECVNDSFFE